MTCIRGIKYFSNITVSSNCLVSTSSCSDLTYDSTPLVLGLDCAVGGMLSKIILNNLNNLNPLMEQLTSEKILLGDFNINLMKSEAETNTLYFFDIITSNLIGPHNLFNKNLLNIKNFNWQNVI